MSSGFSGGFPDFFNANSGGVRNIAGRSISMMNYRSPLSDILSDSSSPVSGPRSDFIGKRSLAEFQHQHQHQQQQQQLRQQSVYLRNVKPRAYNYQNQEMETKMLNRLHELEKELLLDDEDGENDAVSVVTDTTEWSETIQKLLTVSPSPTTSSTSSSATSSSPTISPKQFISDAAEAITEGRSSDIVTELITRINQFSNARGSPEQKLGFYIASALRTRVSASVNKISSPASELYRKEHILSTQLLYDKSPCFKIAFVAANNIIMQAVSGSGTGTGRIHVVDFDVGHGLQYMYLLHEIVAARRVHAGNIPISLKLTTFKDFGNGGSERLKLVGDGLKSLSIKLGVLFYYNVLDFKLSDLNRKSLSVEHDDVLAVNFGFKLSKLPDESVTTENLRDEVLRRVKGLSPAVVTVVEQELNANTASFTVRVNDLFSYYTSFLNSLDATIPRDNPERVKIEEGLSRRIFNSVACEGRDRVERCEVFGKWRARLRMAGFDSKPVSQLSAEALLAKLNAWTRGNMGFTVKEEYGGISFGWMGRTLTVVSAWY